MIDVKILDSKAIKRLKNIIERFKLELRTETVLECFCSAAAPPAAPEAADGNEASGSAMEESTERGKTKGGGGGAGRPGLSKPGSFPVLSGRPVNGLAK